MTGKDQLAVLSIFCVGFLSGREPESEGGLVSSKTVAKGTRSLTGATQEEGTRMLEQKEAEPGNNQCISIRVMKSKIRVVKKGKKSSVVHMFGWCCTDHQCL